jgi:tetratricopeptide (TPR) repeat protein
VGHSRGGRGHSKPAASRTKRRKAPPVEAPELTRSVGRERAKRLEGRIEEAARAFAADRYIDSRRILKPIAKEVPDSPEVRELYGLTLYRLGHWRQAAVQLEAFGDLTAGSVEQHPVLADCYRALGRYQDVDRLWAELREVSPSAELMTEGRIVTAGSLADRGRLSDAVAMLAKGFKLPARSEEHHLRRAYALADLYERSGDLPQARRLLGRIAAISPDYVDVEERLQNLD